MGVGLARGESLSNAREKAEGVSRAVGVNLAYSYLQSFFLHYLLLVAIKQLLKNKLLLTYLQNIRKQFSTGNLYSF